MNVYVCLEFITTVSSHSPEYIEYHPIFNPFSQAFSFGDGPSPSLNFLMYSHVWALLNLHWFGMCFNGYLYRDGVQFQGANLFFFGIVWVVIPCQMITGSNDTLWTICFLGSENCPLLGPKIFKHVTSSTSFWEIYQLDGLKEFISTHLKFPG